MTQNGCRPALRLLDARLALNFLMVFALANGAAYGQGKSVSDLDLGLPDIGPTITAQDYHNRRVEEYSVNNNVYMIKVTPKAGSPYYLVDPKGSGQMEWRRNSSGFEVQPPQWALKTW